MTHCTPESQVSAGHADNAWNSQLSLQAEVGILVCLHSSLEYLLSTYFVMYYKCCLLTCTWVFYWLIVLGTGW